MFLFLGILPQKKPIKFHQQMICEACGSYGSFEVWMTCQVLYIFFIPVYKWDKKYYVETTCCHTIYELDPEIGRDIEKGKNVEIHQNNLMRLYRGKKVCPYCGYHANPDFEYCPKCGSPLD